jgi:hypothetical protein
MARADQLLAGMLTAMRREDELLAALLDDLQGEDSSDEEDEVEEMWIVQDLLTSMCALEARLCEVEARLDEAESAEQQQQSAVDVCAVETRIERVPMIEIDVADAKTTAAAAGMFHRAVVAEMAAAAVVWWGDSEEKEAVMKDVVWYGDWMREWEAMVRWCGGGRWRRLLLIE